MKRITTGTAELDDIFDGGLPQNSLAIVAGAPGTGKTILAQRFALANARPDAPALYLTTLSEPAAKMLRYLQRFAFFDEDKLLGDHPALVYRDIAEAVRDRGLDALPETVVALMAEHRPAYLVIDSFKALRDLGPPGPELRRAVFTPAVPAGYDASDERVSTGVTDLDRMVHGGLRRASSTLVVGSAGSGKTLLGLHVLFAGVAAGEHGLLVSFQENPTLLRHLIAGFGRGAGQLGEGGRLTAVYVSPVEMNVDDIIQRVLAVLAARPIRRVVIDSLGDLEATSSDPQRFRSYVYALMQLFAVRGVTSYATYESLVDPDFASFTRVGASYINDNVIALRYFVEGGAHDSHLRKMTIGARGVEIDGAPPGDG